MAGKYQPRPGSSASDPSTLAEALFVANWSPSLGYTADSVARKCIEAARAFARVADEMDKPRQEPRIADAG